MAFPTGWNRRGPLVIQNGQVSGSGSHTDLPVLLTEDNFDSEIFDADGSNPAQNGGGDLRFSSDSAGATQLPIDVVSFVTDNDPANGTAEVWVKVASVSTSADTTIYVWYNTAGAESQPAVTDTYGRNAVWSDYDGVYHGNDLVDSTGNGNTLTGVNSPISGDTNGKIGDAFLLDDASEEYFSGGSSLADTPITLQGWFNPDTDTGVGQGIVSLWSSADADYARLTAQSNLGGDPVRAQIRDDSTTNQSVADTTVGISYSSWNMAHATFTDGTVAITVTGWKLSD